MYTCDAFLIFAPIRRSSVKQGAASAGDRHLLPDHVGPNSLQWRPQRSISSLQKQIRCAGLKATAVTGRLLDQQSSGVDMAQYGKSPSGVTVDLGLFTASGGDGDDVFIAIGGIPSIEDVTGSGKGDTLIGNGFNNRLVAGGGDDTVDATQGGADIVTGSAGNDALDVQDTIADDTVNGGAGTDTCSLDPGDLSSLCP